MLYVYQTRKTYNGFMQWTIAFVLYCIAMAFMSLRNILPDFFSIILQNTLIIAGCGLTAYGIELFTKSPKRKWMFATLTLTIFLVSLFFTYYIPHVNARIITIAVITALINGYAAYLVSAAVPRLIAAKNTFLVFSFSILSIWSVLRAVQTIFFEKAVLDFFNTSIFQAATIAVFFCGNILVMIGLIILNFQKVEFDLSIAMEEIKTLKGIIPICSYCKKIRDDEGFWNQVEAYVAKHTEAKFSHSICPKCMAEHHPEVFDNSEG